MEFKPGTKLRSTTDSTEVIVVKGSTAPVDLKCGGHPMVAAGDPGADDASAVVAGFDEGTQLGKRYADDEVGIEVLCTKAGPASLSLGDQRLHIKGAKPLPSSD